MGSASDTGFNADSTHAEPVCPECNRRLIRDGKTAGGNQRFRCADIQCGRHYVPSGAWKKHPAAIKQQAGEFFKKGYSFREIASQLKVSLSTLSRWRRQWIERKRQRHVT